MLLGDCSVLRVNWVHTFLWQRGGMGFSNEVTVVVQLPSICLFVNIRIESGDQISLKSS